MLQKVEIGSMKSVSNPYHRIINNN